MVCCSRVGYQQKISLFVFVVGGCYILYTILSSYSGHFEIEDAKWQWIWVYSSPDLGQEIEANIHCSLWIPPSIGPWIALFKTKCRQETHANIIVKVCEIPFCWLKSINCFFSFLQCNDWWLNSCSCCLFKCLNKRISLNWLKTNNKQNNFGWIPSVN